MGFQKRVKPRYWTRIVSLALVVNVFISANVKAENITQPPSVQAKAAELIDANSGQVLFSKNARQKLPMASVTKLMTLYLAVQALDRQQIRLGDLVPADEQTYHIKGSQIWLEPGERLTVDQMLKAVAVGSANDAAYALGTFLAGSEEAFVNRMNQTANNLGMHDTHFSNPHGLHAPNHYTTAHDLSLLSQKAVTIPLLLHYTSMWEDRTIRNGKGGTLWLINHNRLLRNYPGTDGLKTGFTHQAGYCLAATAKRSKMRMIVSLLGEPTGKARIQDASLLMSWGFQNFRTISIAKAQALQGRVRVLRGTRPYVDAVIKKPVAITQPISEQGVQSVRDLNREVAAPVAPGQVLGYLLVKNRRTILRQIPIQAKEAVPKITLTKLAWRYWWKLFA